MHTSLIDIIIANCHNIAVLIRLTPTLRVYLVVNGRMPSSYHMKSALAPEPFVTIGVEFLQPEFGVRTPDSGCRNKTPIVTNALSAVWSDGHAVSANPPVPSRTPNLCCNNGTHNSINEEVNTRHGQKAAADAYSFASSESTPISQLRNFADGGVFVRGVMIFFLS